MKIRMRIMLLLFIVSIIIVGCRTEGKTNVTFEEVVNRYDSAIYIDLFAFDSKILKGENINVQNILEVESQQRMLQSSKEDIKKYAPYPGIIFFDKEDPLNYIAFRTDDYIFFYNDELCFEYNIKKQYSEELDFIKNDKIKELDVFSLDEEEYVMRSYSDFFKMDFQMNFCSVSKEDGKVEYENYDFVWGNKGLNKDTIVLWKKNKTTGYFELRGKNRKTAVFYRKNDEMFINQKGEYILTDKLRKLYNSHAKE